MIPNEWDESTSHVTHVVVMDELMFSNGMPKLSLRCNNSDVSSGEVEHRLYILCTIVNVSTVKVSSIMSRWVVDVLMSDVSKVAARRTIQVIGVLIVLFQDVKPNILASGGVVWLL